MRTLIGLRYSPWSERARWALDHHRLAFRFVDHVPMLGEPLLRLRARRLRGRVTVPLLLEEDGSVFMDSLAIARHADACGAAPKLIPDELAGDIESWNALAEDALVVARKWVVKRTGESEDAMRASLPKVLRNAPGALASAKLGVAFFQRKYELDLLDPSKAPLVRFLDQLRKALGVGGRERAYVLGSELTYADVLAATTLQCVRPVAAEHWRIDPALVPIWTDDDLAAKYADLLAYRDRIYGLHRKAAASP